MVRVRVGVGVRVRVRVGKRAPIASLGSQTIGSVCGGTWFRLGDRARLRDRIRRGMGRGRG